MIRPNEYDEGNLIRLTGTFRNSAGALVDPTTVSLKYKNSAGVVSSVTPTHDSLGVFHFDLDTTGFPVGRVGYKFYGVGAVIAAKENAFLVTSPSEFGI